jgi:hyperosmotically inducible protein
VKAFLALILGIAIGAAALWFFTSSDGRKTVESTSQQIEEAAQNASSAVQEKLKSWDLEPESIKAELERSGQVVRKKAQEAGKAISDATADARITAAIKAKLVREPGLSSLSISVNTTDGLVTLSGTVDSPEAISRAMLLEMETEGVREVASTLQVRKKK